MSSATETVPEEYDIDPNEPGDLGQPVLLSGETNSAMMMKIHAALDAHGLDVSVEYTGEYQRVFIVHDGGQE